MSQMMNEQWLLAQQPSRKLQSKSAMEGSFNGTVFSLAYSCDTRLVNASKRFVDDGTIKQCSSSLRFFSKNSSEEK
jgi:hypothetical protein